MEVFTRKYVLRYIAEHANWWKHAVREGKWLKWEIKMLGTVDNIPTVHMRKRYYENTICLRNTQYSTLWYIYVFVMYTNKLKRIGAQI